MTSHVLIVGGCGESRERDVRDTCQLVTLKLSSEVKGQEEKMLTIFTEKSWPSLNRPRRGAFLCKLPSSTSGSSDDAVTVVGGCSSETEHLRSLETYDRRAGRWRPSTDDVLAAGKSCFAAVVLPARRDETSCRSLLHCLGGWDGRVCSRDVDVVERVDPEKPVFAGFRRQMSTTLKNSFCIRCASKTFVIGGWDGRRTLDAIFEYDSDSDSEPSQSYSDSSLKYVGTLPYPLECHAAVYWPRGRRVILVGGFDGVSIRSDLIAIDPDNLRDTVVLPDRLKIRRENLCAELVFDDYLLIFGGWDGYRSLRSAELLKITRRNPDDSASIDIKNIDFFENLLTEPRQKACSIVLNDGDL